MQKVIFPDEHKYLTFLKKVFRHEFRKSGFRRISVPLLENGKLRESSEKGVMKAYIDNNIFEEIQPIYYYFMDRFLCEDKEEYRIGGNIIWENDPILDAIMIYITYTVLNKIGLSDKFNIKINSNWIEKEKIKYIEELINFYSDKKHLLTEKWLKNLEENPLLLLCSENEDEKILAKNAPKMFKFLKKDSKNHYLKFMEYLDLLEIPYTEDHTLVANNSYNTNTLWNINDIETWEIISKWARYNYLAKELWHTKDVPASWFFVKTSKIISLLKNNKIKIKNKDKIDLFIVQLWDDAKKIILPISLKAREAWINTVVSLWTPSMKEQMLKAQRSWAKYVVIVGVMEARTWVFQIRNNVAWTQEEVKKEDLIDYIINKIWKDSLDFYCPARDLTKD